MPFFRLFVVLLGLGVSVSSCAGCGRAPVKNTLKPDGEACANDEECESSLCDKLPGKSTVCFKKCAAGCKTGDICEALAANDRFACVPELPGLCQPCALNVDCPYPGDRCVEIGGTKVCSRDCSFDGQCPASYRCADGTDTNGAFVTKQCQPTSGTCSCTAASAGQTTPCNEVNSFGTCNGVRTCRPPNGYEACTAPVPTAESCNGRDDDCNGMTDENLGQTTCGIGECRRTVTNCINGAPQQCDPLPAGIEICDVKDNNCNGVVDEGFDKMTSLTHCGTCNTPCARPHATPVCMGGMCGIGMCDPGFINANGIDLDGCELMCTITGAEICDGIDNNCNGVVDEGFSLTSDPTNCGICGRVCNVMNGNIASYACAASQCGIMTCSTGFADCDQTYGTGCEKGVSADVNNCGGCNAVCTTANATPSCAASTCGIGSCNVGYADCDMLVSSGCEIQIATNVDFCGSCINACPARTNAARTCVAGGCGFTCNAGWVNLDGLASNGCEYMCTSLGADAPELTFADSNCDGIDGDAANAIFVSLTGNDANPGNRALPKRTLNTAIGAAASLVPKRAVYASMGVYNEAVVMQPGVSLYGGYDAASGWSRALTNTTIIASGSAVGVLAQNISLTVELQLFTITSANASGTEANGDGRSSIGVHIINSAAGVTVHACTITVGTGTAGSSGPSGATGTAGGAGGAASGTTQGGGGFSPCAAPGGAGGPGVGWSSGGLAGTAGTQAPAGGAAGNAGSGGAVGVCNSTSSADGSPAPPVTAGGSSGNVGANGIAGSALGTVSAGLYLPASGLSGSPGAPGGGAGGGGSGGSSANGTNFFCTNCSGINSGGGGGGGAGACGGSPGTPGRGGGGSFAILVANSTATVTNTTMRSSNAGLGGAGGAGGFGGNGAAGGAGAGGGNRNNSCSNRSAGGGANGAQGGAGGRGGGGAGGAGGPCICLGFNGAAPTNTGNTCITGTPGSGGLGGTNGIQNAASGPPGTVTQVQAL